MRLCKCDGVQLVDPLHVAERDDAGLPVWQKIMVDSWQLAKADGRPRYLELVRRLRQAEAHGATVLPSTAGFYGEHKPMADRLLALQRNAPVHTVIVDTPDRRKRQRRTLTRRAGAVYGRRAALPRRRLLRSSARITESGEARSLCHGGSGRGSRLRISRRRR